MTSSSVRKLVAFVALIAFMAVGVAAWAYSQANNQLLREADMASAVTDSTFINTGGCTFSGNKIVSRARFISCIQNNGACAGSTSYMLTFGDAVACRVLYTLHTLNISGTAIAATSQVCSDPDNLGHVHCTGPTAGHDYSVSPPGGAVVNASFPATASITVSGTGCSWSFGTGGGGTGTFTQTDTSGGGIFSLTTVDGIDSGDSCSVSGTITYYS